mmetsp:Transcript_26340/g.39902  ORF Transcript_26340/g.39902 Transcript_26340/m.39902 type:complete len:332 (-) Transcript_26340:95-1090(-)
MHNTIDDSPPAATTQTKNDTASTTLKWKSDPTKPVLPQENDVLCGRGKTAYLHCGNQRLQQDMIDRLSEFEAAHNRFEKSLIVRDCIQAVIARGGRFLKKQKDECWFVTGFNDARDKVSHALRNNAGRGFKALHDPTRYDPTMSPTSVAYKSVEVISSGLSSTDSNLTNIINDNNSNEKNLFNQVNLQPCKKKTIIKPWDANPTQECIPQPSDVLCGRGKRATLHPGNQRLQLVLSQQAAKFQATSYKAEKSSMVHELIADTLRGGGRFLKKDLSTGKWFLASFNDAREKISHAFRNVSTAAPTKNNMDDVMSAVSGLCSLSKNKQIEHNS